MVELNANLLSLTLETFKTRALSKSHLLSNKRILEDPLSMTLEQLCEYYNECLQDSDLQNYFFGLLTIKLSRDSPLPNSIGIQYIDLIVYFINRNPSYANIILSSYTSALIQEISQAKTIESLSAWADKLQLLSAFEDQIVAVKTWLKIAFTQEIYSLLSQMGTQPANKDIKIKIANFILICEKAKMDINDLSTMSTSMILDNIIRENDLKDIYKNLGDQVKTDFEAAKEVVSYLKLIKNIDNQAKQQLNFIESRLGSILIPHPENKTYQKTKKLKFVNENLIQSNSDLSTMEFEQHGFYTHDTEEFNVTLYRGTIQDSKPSRDNSLQKDRVNIVVKIYTIKSATFDCTPIKTEIDILTFLSNRSTPENMYLKLYCALSQDDKHFIYMEACGENLMNYITKCKVGKMQRKSRSVIEGWISSLVVCFAELAVYRIYHRDIKPHNILATKDDKLKIIDFSISQIKEEIEYTLTPTDVNPVQGTPGYLAPEIQELMDRGEKVGPTKPGKSDVYSLGLTILQLITFENLLGLNKADKVNDLNRLISGADASDWIKKMLYGMLEYDRKRRLSINKCLFYVPSYTT